MTAVLIATVFIECDRILVFPSLPERSRAISFGTTLESAGALRIAETGRLRPELEPGYSMRQFEERFEARLEDVARHARAVSRFLYAALITPLAIAPT